MANLVKGAMVVLSIGTGDQKSKILHQTQASFNETADVEEETTKDNFNPETGMLDKVETVTGKRADINCTYYVDENTPDTVKVGEKYGFSLAGGGITHTGVMLVKSRNEDYPLNGKVPVQISATTVGAYT